MWSVLYYLIVFLFTIFLITGVHELGHYLLARIFGIKVLRFSIGFGKSLGKLVDKRGTEYQLALIPIGGYVKLLDSREGPVAPQELPDAFDKRPCYQRFFVLIAGPAFNFLLAILAFWLIFIHGVTYVKPIVGEVAPHSLAANAHIQPQDEIVAINHHAILGWTSVAIALIREYGSAGDLIIAVKEAKTKKITQHTINIKKGAWQLDKLRPNIIKSMGISPYIPVEIASRKDKKMVWPPAMLQTTHYTIIQALAKAINETNYLITFNSIVIYKMLTGAISWHGLGGPISIFQAAANAAEYGFIIYLNFIALISISIGLLNLLPIPGLDGAQIIYLLYELIRGRPVSVAAQLLAFRIGAILLFILMLQALLSDLARLM